MEGMNIFHVNKIAPLPWSIDGFRTMVQEDKYGHFSRLMAQQPRIFLTFSSQMEEIIVNKTCCLWQRRMFLSIYMGMMMVQGDNNGR